MSDPRLRSSHYYSRAIWSIICSIKTLKNIEISLDYTAYNLNRLMSFLRRTKTLLNIDIIFKDRSTVRPSMKTLKSFSKHLSTLHNLHVIHINLSPSVSKTSADRWFYQTLIPSIKFLPNLRRLWLDGLDNYCYGHDSTTFLCPWPTNVLLLSLTFKVDKIRSSVFWIDCLNDSLLALKHLESLELNFVWFTGHSNCKYFAERLAQTFPKLTQLKCLGLSIVDELNEFTIEDCEMLAKGIGQMTSLTKLSIKLEEFRKLISLFHCMIAEVRKLYTLKHLTFHVSKTVPSDDQLKELIDMLKNLLDLESLSLLFDNLDKNPSEILELFEQIFTLKYLKHLTFISDLPGNVPSKRFQKFKVKAERTGVNLNKLHLRLLNRDGNIDVADLLQKLIANDHTQLQDFRLQCSGFEHLDKTELFEVIQILTHNVNLEKLKLEYFAKTLDVSDDDMEKMLLGLASLKNLWSLRFGILTIQPKKLTDKTVTTIRKCLLRLKKLKEIVIDVSRSRVSENSEIELKTLGKSLFGNKFSGNFNFN